MAPPGLMESRRGTPIGPPSKSRDQIARELDAARGRKEFFSNRPDVSDDRAYRRMKQFDEMRSFKNKLIDSGRVLKGVRPDGTEYVVTNTNTGEPVYLGTTPKFDTDSSSPTFGQYTSTSVADKGQQLANLYGPTFSEIGSDIGYGLGSIGRGLGDFIGKGGVIGSVLSGLYDKFKGGTQQGIETVGGLYDNLRSAFSGQPTVNYGGGSTITTTTNQPAIDLTPASIETETLPSMDLNRNIGDESDPSIFGLENPLFRDTQYEPINVQDMDMSGVNSLQLSEVNPQQRQMLDQYLFNKMIQEEINRNKQQKINRDMQMYQTNPTGQPVLMAENVGLPSLMDLYNFAKNPQVETPMGNLRFDNVLSGNPQLGYGNTVMINGVPVDLNATIGNQGLSVGGSFSFKKGGSVDKYAGLGYKLK